jgi:hypothetical protein
MLILLVFLFLIGLVIWAAASTPALKSQKSPGELIELKSDSLARLNIAEALMKPQQNLKDYFEPIKIREPSPPPRDIFEPNLLDIAEPVIDQNARCRLTGLPISECDCTGCVALRKKKR